MWHCRLLDLEDDAALIAAYRDHHRPGNVPAPVLAAIRASGITAMDIYTVGDRLVMMMRTAPGFDPAAKSASDASDPAIVAWEAAMGRLQRPLPFAPAGEKWIAAERIFALSEQP